MVWGVLPNWWTDPIIVCGIPNLINWDTVIIFEWGGELACSHVPFPNCITSPLQSGVICCAVFSFLPRMKCIPIHYSKFWSRSNWETKWKGFKTILGDQWRDLSVKNQALFLPWWFLVPPPPHCAGAIDPVLTTMGTWLTPPFFLAPFT